MDLTNLKARLKTDFLALGSFESDTSDDKLESAILVTALHIWNAKAWPFKSTSDTLSTQAGTLGPYDPPSNFYTFVDEKRISILGEKDRQSIWAVKDSDTRRWYPYYDDIEDKIYFMTDPGSNTLTIGFQRQVDNTLANISTTIGYFPEELFLAFYHGVPAEVLNIPGALNESRFYEQKRDAAIEKAWADYQRGRSRQKERVPYRPDGQPYDGIGRPRPLYPVTGTGTFVNGRSW